jgi:hypothetical protein
MKIEWHEQEDRTIMCIPLDPESMIIGHGGKIHARRRRRGVKYLSSGSRFAFQNFFSQ